MTIEEKLKDYILSNYKSLRNFVNSSGIDLPYSTIDGMLKRGIGNATIDNVLKICKTLNISADELANNRIVPINTTIQSRSYMTDIDKIIEYTKRNIHEYNDLTIDGQSMSENEIEMLLDGLDIAIGIIKRNRKRNGK